MPALPLVSYVPDGEDVVVWRALRDHRPGRYLDSTTTERVGSFTRLFYDQGWDGWAVLPAAALDPRRRDRPRESVVTELPALADLHLWVVDAGTPLPLVLPGTRPWVVIVAGDAPGGWEAALVSEDYRQVPASPRVFVAAEHAALTADLSAGPHRRDGYETVETVDLRRSRDEALAGLLHWRAEALTRWAQGTAGVESASAAELVETRRMVEHLRAELDATHATVSWRVTAPLRAVRRRRR